MWFMTSEAIGIFHGMLCACAGGMASCAQSFFVEEKFPGHGFRTTLSGRFVAYYTAVAGILFSGHRAM